MAGFSNFDEINQAYEAGRVTTSGFRKLISAVTATGVWFDLSMTGGGPPPNYYASTPLIWSTLTQSADGGIYHGGAVSPASKRLKSLMMASSIATAGTPAVFVLCDYLGYWPFVDMIGSVSLSGSGLTRYTDGVGVKAMVILAASQAGGATFNLTYTGPQGSGRTSKTMICNTSTLIGNIVTTAPTITATYPSSPFVSLQDGDTGITSIQSVNWLTEDVGLVAVVLVKPLAQIYVSGIDTGPNTWSPSEKDFAIHTVGAMPEIQDNAYLNLICHPSGSLATAVVHGMMETIWTA